MANYLVHSKSAGAVAARPPGRDRRNTRVVLGEVVDIDLDARQVTVDTIGQRSWIAYDSLIVATGASQSYFGHSQFAHDAPGMKTIDDALELRGRIFGAFEMAEREADPAARRRYLTFVVVGAGPTGVELAGQLAELSHRSLRGNFRHIDPAEARVVVLDAASTILPAFPNVLRERATRDLRDMGVEIHVGTMVTSVDQLGVDTNAKESHLRRIEAATKIWAAGVEASPLGRILARAPGVDGDHIAPAGDRGARAAARLRLPRMGALAADPSHDADWLQEPHLRRLQLDGRVRRARAPRAVITAQQVFARHALEAHAGEHGTVPPIATTVAAKAQGTSALPETSA
jgi:NADPH-dependent 2,4-dienoyl-CoA reductase/sulfur reductase-like enzyme